MEPISAQLYFLLILADAIGVILAIASIKLVLELAKERKELEKLMKEEQEKNK